jgi:hypothetical protein
MKRRTLLTHFWLGVGLFVGTHRARAQSLQVAFDRWLELREMSGTVTYQRGQTAQSAQIGTRLQAVGDSIRTGARSRAVLAVDNGIGFVDVSENTLLRIQTLQTTAGGGRVTRLHILQGQARLRVRRFTNPDSQLEIQTPAGVSGVRGTEFGVSVQPDGKTGVATLEGSVVASAEGQSVPINGGFQSLVIPGEAPLPPMPLTENTQLNLQLLAPINQQRVRVVGQVEPVNIVMLGAAPISLDRQGRFDVEVIVSSSQSLDAVVITPLGKRQVYRLAL